MSAKANIPHLSLPFRFVIQPGGKKTSAVAEQDTVEDIANCVEAIVNTHVGWRDERPDFGIPDFVFQRTPIGSDKIHELIAEQEPRADISIEESTNLYDELNHRIEIAVAKRGGGVG